MTMEVCPDRGVGVEIFAPFNVAKNGPVAFNDYNRLTLDPITHLGEGMPHVTTIKLDEGLHDYDFKSSASRLRTCSAFKSDSTSASVCAAVKVTRKRAVPRGTVG